MIRRMDWYPRFRYGRAAEKRKAQAEVDAELNGPGVDDWKYDDPFYRRNGELDRLDP